MQEENINQDKEQLQDFSKLENKLDRLIELMELDNTREENKEKKQLEEEKKLKDQEKKESKLLEEQKQEEEKEKLTLAETNLTEQEQLLEFRTNVTTSLDTLVNYSEFNFVIAGFITALLIAIIFSTTIFKGGK